MNRSASRLFHKGLVCRHKIIPILYEPPTDFPSTSLKGIDVISEDPYHVYSHIYETLKTKDLFADQMKRIGENCKSRVNAISKAKEQIDKGYVFPILKRSGEGTVSSYDEFVEKLKEDGGDKIFEYRSNILHIGHKRFYSIIEGLKGLSLDDALVELRFHQKTPGFKVHDILSEAIVKAKEDGFDLSKTYLAYMNVNEKGAMFSELFIKEYLKGKGRYGATPHPITCSIEFVLQERETPFDARENDPLEWIRKLIREKQRAYAKTANELYEQIREKRPLKRVY